MNDSDIKDFLHENDSIKEAFEKNPVFRGLFNRKIFPKKIINAASLGHVNHGKSTLVSVTSLVAKFLSKFRKNRKRINKTNQL